MSGPNNILINNFNNLYNPIYCKLLFDNQSNNGKRFMKFPNSYFGSNFKYDPALESYHLSKNVNNESQCLNECSQLAWCSSYSWNSNNGNCIKYNNIPSKIESSTNINSGYSLEKNFPYNNLSNDEKINVKKKCFNQYLNNTYTDTKKNIDLTRCLSFSDPNDTTTSVNIDKECLFNTYNSNQINVISNNTNIYNDNAQYTVSVRDTNIDNYKSLYTNYMNNKENINRINNQLSINDAPTNINNDNNLYINEIENKKNEMNEYSDKIINRIGNENFENQNINYFYKNYIKFIISLILLFLIVYIIHKFLLFIKK